MSSSLWNKKSPDTEAHKNWGSPASKSVPESVCHEGVPWNSDVQVKWDLDAWAERNQKQVDTWIGTANQQWNWAHVLDELHAR